MKGKKLTRSTWRLKEAYTHLFGRFCNLKYLWHAPTRFGNISKVLKLLKGMSFKT
jgi:hypothetical protein